MKGRFVLVCALFVALLMVPAITGAEDEYANRFWTYLTETNPYTGWGYWPGKYGIYPGQTPHGAYLKIYANGIALKAARWALTRSPAKTPVIHKLLSSVVLIIKSTPTA